MVSNQQEVSRKLKMDMDYTSRMKQLLSPEANSEPDIMPKVSKQARNICTTSADNMLNNFGGEADQKIGIYDWKSKSMTQNYQKRTNAENRNKIFKSNVLLAEPEAEASTFNRFDQEHKLQQRPKSANEMRTSGNQLEGLVSRSLIS